MISGNIYENQVDTLCLNSETQDQIVKSMIQACIDADNERDGVCITKFYPNGYGVSIIQNKWSYGGKDGLYELAVLKGNESYSVLDYDTPITSDVIGYLKMDEAMAIADKVSELPATENILEKNNG